MRNKNTFPNAGERARCAVAAAVKSGALQRTDVCQVCGAIAEVSQDNVRGGIVAHHWNGYDHPLDVWWVCGACNYVLPHDGSLRTPESALDYIHAEKQAGKGAMVRTTLNVAPSTIEDLRDLAHELGLDAVQGPTVGTGSVSQLVNEMGALTLWMGAAQLAGLLRPMIEAHNAAWQEAQARKATDA